MTEQQLLYMGFTLGVDLFKANSLPKLFPKNHFEYHEDMALIFPVMQSLVETGYVEVRRDYGISPFFFVSQSGVEFFQKAAKKYIKERGAPVRSMLDAMISQEEDDMARLTLGTRLSLEQLREKYKDFPKQKAP